MEQPALLPWSGAISIKISPIGLSSPTYFAVAASHSELKPRRAFIVMHEKFSCMKSLAPEVIWFSNKGYNKK